jgi:hypothetical protein
MANIRCQAHWDPEQKKVVKTYQILSAGPEDKIHIVTSDAAPIVLKATAWEGEPLGLDKTQDASGNVLYQVPKVPEGPLMVANPAYLPAFLKLECGTIDENGKFVSWGGLGPDGT